MLTHQVLTSELSPYLFGLVISVLGMLVFNICSYYYGYGMGMADHDQVPAHVWRKIDGRWTQKIIYVMYSLYKENDNFTWKWISDISRMGWVQNDPPSKVTILSSEAMLESAHEIIKVHNNSSHK